MRSVCFYFQVHQPFRLKTYRFFEMGVDHHYYDEFQNRSLMQRIAQKSYLPANELMLKLIKKHGKDFNIAFSISGLALDQFELYAPEVIKSFQELAATGNVEFLSETYSHSLASLKSADEFKRQVQHHSDRIKELFGQTPVTFRNTELIYSDAIGELVADMGYRTMLTEGAKHVLGWKSPNYLYHHSTQPALKLLLKNYTLSDDIAFRFSNKGWSEWPLTAEKFAGWLKQVDKKEPIVNLFIDYETFGEHQWADTGIFQFLENLPAQVFKKTDFVFSKPKDIARSLDITSPIQVPHPISWADAERDLTAWLGNEMQDEAFEKLYAAEEKVKHCHNEHILRDWNYLQASDHFYYMCTKWFSDGDVHRYFNPYPSPYEAFINYMNILSDFLIRVDQDTAQGFDYIEEKAKETGMKAKKFAKKTGDKIKEQAKEAGSRLKEEAKKTGDKAKDKAKESWDDVKDYTLEDIAKMSNAKVKELIKKVDLEELTHALRDASDEVREKIIPNMTQSMKKQYEKLETELKKVKKSDLKEFRDKIERQLKDLWNK
jgi:alpha-amylase